MECATFPPPPTRASSASCNPCRTPSGCWPCWKAKRVTTGRWSASSGKNCPPALCWPVSANFGHFAQNRRRRHLKINMLRTQFGHSCPNCRRAVSLSVCRRGRIRALKKAGGPTNDVGTPGRPTKSAHLRRLPQLNRVLDQLQAVVGAGGQGEDRFGVELHGFDGQFPVPDAHDDAALARFGGDFQARGEGFAARVQRVIAAHLEFLRQTLENAQAAVAHHGALAVHGVIEDAQLAAERLDNALQSQAHAEYRDA